MSRITRQWLCLLIAPALLAVPAMAQEMAAEPVFEATAAEVAVAPEYDEAGNLVPPPEVWSGPIATPRQLAAERATVDEYEAMLGAAEWSDRLHAVTVLANLADRAWEPKRVLSLLEASRSDLDYRVALQADTSLLRLAGIETRPPEERQALVLANERESFEEYAAMLGSTDWNDRLHAVTWFDNEAHAGSEAARALLTAAQSDGDARVAAEASSAIARLDEVATRTAEERQALVLANERESFAEYSAMLASKELSDRLHAVVWLANEAHAGNKEAETLLAGARFGADPTVAAEVEAFFAAQAARGLSEVD